ncbi:MAG: hypothetical protein QOH16_659 [Gaiellaceae bacterium]|nr:hypothetical protein [Gaiellaceae bacterium]
MSGFNSVSDALNILVEPFEVTPRWDAVVADAGVAERRHSTSWRTVAIAAVFAAALLAAAAYAAGFGDTFSSWLTGSPGAPAPAAEQQGFAQRNQVAFASFPAGTKLRLLLRETVGGTSFELLGFRNGDTYCLRLVRTKLPQGLGRNECLRAEELRGHAALVANNVWFSVGKPAESITGIYGFAADPVTRLRVIRARGEERVPVKNNVFLSLKSQPSGTVQHHPLPNPVLAVAAVLANGQVRNVPYVVDGEGIIRNGRRPTVPSYFGGRGVRSSVGPARVTAPIRHPAIGWLDRREKRGGPLPLQSYVALHFGRVIQPDPDDPIRVGVAIAAATGFTKGHAITGNALCVIDFQPLMRGAGSTGCSPVPFQNGALMLGSWMSSPITHFNGLAADGITRVVLYLAGGRTVEAALRDNVFVVAVPQAELGGKLVGFDAKGRVAAIQELPGNAVATPCPPAQFVTPVDQLAAPKVWERIDLGSSTVGGQTILGKTPAEVRAILGAPATTRPNAQRTNGVSIPEFRYGGTMPATMGLSISFIKRGDRIVANSLLFQSPSTVDIRLGHVLRMQPVDLQRAIATTYGSRYRLYLRYGSDPRRGCAGEFVDRSGPAGVGFALNIYRPSRPYLSIMNNAGG